MTAIENIQEAIKKENWNISYHSREQVAAIHRRDALLVGLEQAIHSTNIDTPIAEQAEQIQCFREANKEKPLDMPY